MSEPESTLPFQCYRTGQGMSEFCAGAFRFEVRGFQLEVPFRRTVGVVNQHEMRIVLQALGLEFHSAAVLLDKFSKDEFQQFCTEGKPAKKVPGGDHVDAALVAGDRRYRG